MSNETETAGVAVEPSEALPPASPLARRARENWRRFCQNRLALVGLALLILTVVMAVLATVVAPDGPFRITGGAASPAEP